MHFEASLPVRRLSFPQFCASLVDVGMLRPKGKQRLLELERNEVVGWRDMVIGGPETVGVLAEIASERLGPNSPRA